METYARSVVLNNNQHHVQQTFIRIDECLVGRNMPAYSDKIEMELKDRGFMAARSLVPSSWIHSGTVVETSKDLE